VKSTALVLLAAIPLLSCRQIAGIQDLPKPCRSSDGTLIDDLEDGDGWICEVAGRHGPWWTAGDGSDGTLEPVPAAT
jgi:hypothetical protein